MIERLDHIIDFPLDGRGFLSPGLPLLDQSLQLIFPPNNRLEDILWAAFNFCGWCIICELAG